jgi:hypothetical protein
MVWFAIILVCGAALFVFSSSGDPRWSLFDLIAAIVGTVGAGYYFFLCVRASREDRQNPGQ